MPRRPALPYPKNAPKPPPGWSLMSTRSRHVGWYWVPGDSFPTGGPAYMINYGAWEKSGRFNLVFASGTLMEGDFEREYIGVYSSLGQAAEAAAADWAIRQFGPAGNPRRNPKLLWNPKKPRSQQIREEVWEKFHKGFRPTFLAKRDFSLGRRDAAVVLGVADTYVWHPMEDSFAYAYAIEGIPVDSARERGMWSLTYSWSKGGKSGLDKLGAFQRRSAAEQAAREDWGLRIFSLERGS